MGTEAKRGFIRLAANYARLLLLLVLGLALVRLLLRGLGNEAYALTVLLGTSVGLTSLLQEITRRGMVRELSAAFHGGDDGHFRSVYNTALLTSLAVAVLTTAFFGLLMAVLPLLAIPDDLLPAARWFVVAKSVELLLFIVTTPALNMYLVSERMVAFNAWTVAWRAAYVVAAVWIVFVDTPSSMADGIVTYGVLSAVLVISVRCAAAAAITAADRRLAPAPWLATRAAARSILHVSGWNAGVLTAQNLHLRLGGVLMNLAFGLFGNLIFGLAVQLASYVRMIATGMTIGLDAVATRLSTAEGDHAVRSLTHHSTRLHGFVTFPAMLVVGVLAGPVFELWVGGRIEDPATSLPPTITLIRILLVGIAVRSISDGWITILYGAGHVRRYAPVVLAGGVANPLLAGLLLLVMPEPVRYTAIATAFSVILLVVHGVLVPAIGGPLLQMTLRELYAPLLRPLVAATACAPVLVTAAWRIERWTLITLAAVVGVYGVLYLALSLVVVMDRQERRRFGQAALRRLRPGRTPPRIDSPPRPEEGCS